MNYFELYDLPLNFNPDQNLVKQQFYALSKKYHPDFYINESEDRQNEVLDLSTLNNKAFQVLKDPQKRLHYILELKGQLIEGESYSLPQDFLMEMMDVNETLMDLQFEPDAKKLTSVKAEIEVLEVDLLTQLQQHTLAFDESQDLALLDMIKDRYYRSKYLARIKESLKKIA